MNLNEIDIHAALKKYFGFNQFKGLQEQVIKSIINQKNTFVSFYSQTELREHIMSELSMAKSEIETLPQHEYLYNLVQQIENRLQTL